MSSIVKNKQYAKFSAYGFLKNLRFFDAFFILYLNQKGLSYTEIGSLYAIREIVINLAELPSGIIADSYGRKTALSASLLVYIISFFVFYISNDFWLFLLAFVLYGFADAFRSGTHKGMIMSYLKMNDWSDQKVDYYGHTRSWSQMGSALSSLIAGFIVFYSGSYENIFLYSIIPYILNFILILSYPNQLNYSSSAKNKGISSLAATYKSFFQMIKKPVVLQIINTSALHSAYLKAIKDYIQPLLVNLAMVTPILMSVDSEKKNGVFIGVIYFMIYLITSRASAVSSFFDEKYKSRLPYLSLILGFGLGTISGFFYLEEIWLVAVIAFIGIYIVENIRKPVLTGYVSDHTQNEVLTSVLSAQSLLKTIMTAILAFVFGLLADQFNLGTALLIVSILLTLGTFVIHLISKSKYQSA
jgi:MFS family permease